ncbi:hypothetical protein [Rhodococcus opacus]|uniref:Uncharacterized protein n=1 Tax=Rhodococcus opacus (strain B4) TaxID=632772 RepID=C1BEF8_RHOOB|nr:hypothetical protein [Rhodococcus opacus]BAH47259.1 hypothetical protein ROP_pKNR01-00060 [Rhodococcus opacus B4]
MGDAAGDRHRRVGRSGRGFEHPEHNGLGLDDPLTFGSDLFSGSKLNMRECQFSFEFGDPTGGLGRPLHMVMNRVVNRVGRGGSVRVQSSSQQVVDPNRPALLRFDRTGQLACLNAAEQGCPTDPCTPSRLGQ